MRVAELLGPVATPAPSAIAMPMAGPSCLPCHSTLTAPRTGKPCRLIGEAQPRHRNGDLEPGRKTLGIAHARERLEIAPLSLSDEILRSERRECVVRLDLVAIDAGLPAPAQQRVSTRRAGKPQDPRTGLSLAVVQEASSR